MSARHVRCLPAWLALAVTLLNAAKPVVVDDTAYLTFARHLAQDPWHPYAFSIFWYDVPDPSMDVLLPPVVPYWLGLGIAVFGEDLLLLKLWLFPFLWLFTRSTFELLRRFAPGQERLGTALFAFSPAVLPLTNFMLDVPAVAFGMATLVGLMRSTERRSLGWLLAASVAAALAGQTKYTMIVLPAVCLWYGVTHRAPARSALMVALALLLFAAWELFVWRDCGASHFLHHLAKQSGTAGPGGDLVTKLADWLGHKGALVKPLLAYLGGLAAGWGFYCAHAAGFSRRFTRWVATAAATGMLLVAVLPAPPGGILPALVFVPLGCATAVTLALVAGRLLVRRGTQFSPRRSPATWFLVGWLAIELAGYFAVTPFPAARRVIGSTLVVGLIACRFVSLRQRTAPELRPERWVVVYGFAVGLGLFAIDCWDALPECELARASAETIRRNGKLADARIWTQGHWGWQYYIGRAGGELIVPGVSALRPGDWLVFPEVPDAQGFYRPYHGQAEFVLEPERLELVERHVWRDALSATTVPTLYGGHYPIVGRDQPRLTVAVYRVTGAWTPQPLRRD